MLAILRIQTYPVRQTERRSSFGAGPELLNTAPVSLAGQNIQNKQLLVDKEPVRRHQYESLTLRVLRFPDHGRGLYEEIRQWVDKAIIQRKLSELETYPESGPRVFRRNACGLIKRAEDAAHRRAHAQMMIETCADIASHIQSRRRHVAAHKLMPTLLKSCTKTRSLTRAFSPSWKRWQNSETSSHQYEGIDAEIVITIFKNTSSISSGFVTRCWCILRARALNGAVSAF